MTLNILQILENFEIFHTNRTNSMKNKFALIENGQIWKELLVFSTPDKQM